MLSSPKNPSEAAIAERRLRPAASPRSFCRFSDDQLACPAYARHLIGHARGRFLLQLKQTLLALDSRPASRSSFLERSERSSFRGCRPSLFPHGLGRKQMPGLMVSGTLRNMPLQYELAWLVSERCEEIGLTPQKLAQLSGVDIDIVQQLLGRGGDATSISDAERIANAVGLSLGILGHRRRPESPGKASVIAGRTASTSFADTIPPDALNESLKTGVAPAEYRPHLRALLDEASVALLSRLAYELHDGCGTPPRETWQKMRALAVALACSREIWN